MNRIGRRSLNSESASAVKNAKAFVLVTWDGKGIPIYRYSVDPCQDNRDVRHVAMQQCAELVEEICGNAFALATQLGSDAKIKEAVEAAKDKRSAELASSICPTRAAE